jgi:hypothetical protein
MRPRRKTGRGRARIMEGLDDGVSVEEWDFREWMV